MVGFLSLSSVSKFHLACKLKALKADLRVRNAEVLGNVERQKAYSRRVTRS